MKTHCYSVYIIASKSRTLYIGIDERPEPPIPTNLGAAFVWYVVALEIEAIAREWSMAGLGIHARVVVNASLVAAGLLFLFLFMKNWGSSHLIMAPQYRVGILSCFAWALVIVIVCGRDLIRCAASEGQAQF